MTTPSTRDRAQPNKAALVTDTYSFRAPRHGDLVVCPYCDPEGFSCDHCGGERRVSISEVF